MQRGTQQQTQKLEQSLKIETNQIKDPKQQALSAENYLERRNQQYLKTKGLIFMKMKKEVEK